MLGGNEAWMILYNRFVLGKSRAVYGREKSFDHIILGNVFVLPEPKDPAILFGSPDCTGIEIEDNLFYGPVKTLAAFSGGIGSFAVIEGNRILPIPEGGVASIPRPEPEITSIFDWQRSSDARLAYSRSDTPSTP